MSRTLLAVLFITLTMFPSHAPHADEGRCDHKDAAGLHAEEVAPILQHLKGVNLHVVLLSQLYKGRIDCHGKEEQCAVGFQKDFAQTLKDEYNSYPKVLLPQHLTDVFTQLIKEELASVIDEKCTPFTILNDAPTGYCIDVTTPEEEVSCSKKRLADYTNDANNLTFLVTVKIEDPTIKIENLVQSRDSISAPKKEGDRRIAIVNWTPVRKNCAPAYLETNTSVEEVIALGDDDGQIEKHVDRLVVGAGLILHRLKTGQLPDAFSCSEHQ